MAMERLGILFYNDDRWVGGTYYLINLIKSLASLDPFHRPDLIVFYNHDSAIEILERLDYPELVAFDVRKHFNDLPIIKFGSRLMKRDSLMEALVVDISWTLFTPICSL